MLTRLVLGILKGLLIGGLLAAALVYEVGWASLPLLYAYAAAALAGALVGLVAGNPIWQKGAKIEALLKSFFGALLGGAALFALQKWLPLNPELVPWGHSQPGQVSVAALPMVATLLAVLFELDHTPSKPSSNAAALPAELPTPKVRLPNRIASEQELPEERVRTDSKHQNSSKS